MNEGQMKNDIKTAIANWVNGFKEPIGLETLARGLAGHWHEEICLDDFHKLLEEMVNEGIIKDAGHWRYEI